MVRRSFPLACLLLAAGCGGDSGSVPEPDRGLERRPEEPMRSVVLFTVDTLRYDALGCYGSTAGESPHIDRFAADAIVFERSYTQASHTHPALTSMHTGLFPYHHGVLGQGGRMVKGIQTIAVQLQKHGIATGQFTANMCMPQDYDRTVMHDGWDEKFCGVEKDKQQYQWDSLVVRRAISWIGDQEGRFFCWVHLMDPHAEHSPPPNRWDHAAHPIDGRAQWDEFQAFERAGEIPPRARLDELQALYRAEVAGADDLLGRFLESLDGRPDRDEIAVIFSSDHGEELFETAPRYTHGGTLTEGVLRVPLIVQVPGLGHEVYEAPVETLQIAPTVLQLFDVPAGWRMDGTSLFADAPSRGEAVSFCGRVLTLRTREHRVWYLWDSLPQPDDVPYWRELNEDSPVPWYSLARVAASYDGGVEFRNVPRFVADEELDGEELADAWRRLGGYMTRLKPVDLPAGIDDAAFLKELEDLGYF